MDRHTRRVFILRPDNLGDVVLFSGALRHIRAHYPQAEITLCVKRYVRNLLELCPHVDRIISWEDVGEDMHRSLLQWLPPIRGRWRLESRLRWPLLKLRYRTDVLLLPVRSPEPPMHAFAGAIWAGTRYGIAGDFNNQSPTDDRTADAIYTERLRLSPERRQEHEFLITRDFLRFLGIEVTLEDLWPEFWTDAGDRRWAEESVPRSEGVVTLGVCPGVTSLPGKFYPGENYARVLSALAEMHFTVVLFGSTAEKPQCEEVAQVLARCENVVSVTNLAGRSTIRQLIEGLRRCDAVLAQETAALHIGVALRKPTVGILGGGHYARFYPWGDPVLNRVALVPMDCYWCNWICRYSTIRCIQEIPPEAIATELRTALRLSDQSVWSH